MSGALPEKIVLSYGSNTCLYASDVATLRGTNWLNDKIIDFFSEYVLFSVKLLERFTNY